MSSSSAILPKQYWYTGLTGAQTLRDVSEYTRAKKRQAIFRIKPSGVTPDITQSLENTLSYRFALIGCTGGVGATGGQFPTNVVIPYPAYPNVR
jgi:hypothetical protein